MKEKKLNKVCEKRGRKVGIRMDKIESFKKELKKIIDPEIGVNIVDMGLVKKIKKTGPNEVEVEFVPTTPFCPIVNFFVVEIEKAAKKVGLKCNVVVEKKTCF